MLIRQWSSYIVLAIVYEWQTLESNVNTMNLWQNGQYLWNIFFSGIHIPGRPVIPEDNNLVQTIKITSKVPVRMSEILLNHKIFSKVLRSLIIFIYFPCALITSYLLKIFRIMGNNKQLLSTMKSNFFILFIRFFVKYCI